MTRIATQGFALIAAIVLTAASFQEMIRIPAGEVPSSAQIA